MSILIRLQEKNLMGVLEELLTSYRKKADDSSIEELRSSVDNSGLKGPATMTLVGQMQRAGKLRSGLYKEFVTLHKRLEDESPVAQPVSEEAIDPEGGAIVSDKEAIVESGSAEGVSEAPEVTSKEAEASFSGSQKEETKIRERMAKEEEKMRSRLLAKEAKIRDRMKMRAERNAQKKGMQVEQIQGIKERQDRLKELREEMGVLREEAKKLRLEVKELRPARKKRAPKEGAEEAPAEKKLTRKERKAAAVAAKAAETAAAA